MDGWTFSLFLLCSPVCVEALQRAHSPLQRAIPMVYFSKTQSAVHLYKDNNNFGLDMQLDEGGKRCR